MIPHSPSHPELRGAEAATWGDRRQRNEGLQQPRLKKWMPHRSGAMHAFFSVELPSGMIVHDLRLMAGKNGFWVAMPAQKQLDRDSNPRLDANGKPLYSQILEFRDRATADRFGAMVLDVIRAEHPDALAAGAS
jgi:hypothetical protein